MKGKVTSPDVKSVVAGSERISSLFSSEQRAFFVAAETRAFLSGKGIDLSGEQQTKTQTALQFFSEELRSTR